MAIKAVLGVIVFALIAALVGGIVLAVLNSARGKSTRPGVIIAVVGLLGALIVGPLNAGLVLVQPNEMGVIFRQTSSGDAALREPLTAGLKWVVPFVDQVQIYDIGQQSLTMASASETTQESGHGGVRSVTKDGQVITVDVTAIFRIDPAQVNQIHRSWRGDYQDGFIIPQTRSEVRNAISTQSAEEIYSGGRAGLEAQIVNTLEKEIKEQGFILTSLLIRDVTFSPEFTQAIEQKQIAQQQAEQAAFRVQQAQQEAEQARVEAKGKADAAVIAAQGEAQGITIRAEAQAKALDQINQVLSQNPNLIQWQYINQLGDNVRLIIVPSNSPFLFNLQDLLQQAGATEVTGQPLTAPEDQNAPPEDVPAPTQQP
jgi:regulator of protease activity HflC (stomatin/prohibitin superfamily)